jgi:hypothetical protein
MFDKYWYIIEYIKVLSIFFIQTRKIDKFQI